MRRVILMGGIRNWAGDLTRRAATPRGLIEAVLIAALVVQGGRLAWTLAAPARVAPAGAVAPVDMAVLGRFDAFFRTGAPSALAETTAAGSSQMRLFGVRAGGPGEGAAIIGLADGRQVSVAVGEQVEPGLVLQSVGPDHAVLARGGSLSRIDFAEVPVGAAPPPPPPTTPQVVTPGPVAAPSPGIDPAALIAQGALRPRMRGLAVTGFTVGDGAGALTAAGLQSGDVITAINDIELTGVGRLNEVRGRLARAESAVIRFERGGETRTITVRTSR